jgi:hypothetical protein
MQGFEVPEGEFPTAVLFRKVTQAPVRHDNGIPVPTLSQYFSDRNMALSLESIYNVRRIAFLAQNSPHLRSSLAILLKPA